MGVPGIIVRGLFRAVNLAQGRQREETGFKCKLQKYLKDRQSQAEVSALDISGNRKAVEWANSLWKVLQKGLLSLGR